MTFVHGELIGWFAIGGSVVSDRLPRPRASKHIIREEMTQQERLKATLIKDYEGT